MPRARRAPYPFAVGFSEPDLAAAYRTRLRMLVSRSPLSHDHIATVLRDMLESDLVILWQLMGTPVQSEAYEESFGAFMERVQNAAAGDGDMLEDVRAAIADLMRQFEETEGELPEG